MFMKHYAPNRCEPSIEFQGGGGGQDGCKRIIEVFGFCEKLKKKIRGGGGGGQGRYEQKCSGLGGGGASGWF